MGSQILRSTNHSFKVCRLIELYFDSISYRPKTIENVISYIPTVLL